MISKQIKFFLLFMFCLIGINFPGEAFSEDIRDPPLMFIELQNNGETGCAFIQALGEGRLNDANALIDPLVRSQINLKAWQWVISTSGCYKNIDIITGSLQTPYENIKVHTSFKNAFRTFNISFNKASNKINNIKLILKDIEYYEILKERNNRNATN